MRLRPYIRDLDFDAIKGWDVDERSHAMWCANLIDYPLEKDSLEKALDYAANQYEYNPFVATTDEGKVVGFFCYSLNLTTNEGMLKFVIISPSERGTGKGKEMLKLAVQYAFDITKANAVQLNVFLENIVAKRCYTSIGFKERKTENNAFIYQNEAWGRCNMVKVRDDDDS